jgi:hypothetical protein
MPKTKVIKPISQKKLPIKHHGHNVIRMDFKGLFTREEIKKYAQQQSNLLLDKGFNGQIQVSLLLEDGWRSGYYSKVGAPISLYEYLDSNIDRDEEDEFTKFQIYILQN